MKGKVVMDKLEELQRTVERCRDAFHKIEYGSLPCGKTCDETCDNCHDEITENGTTCMTNIARKMRIELEEVN